MQLCAKFQKNLMRGSPHITLRTDGRTRANPYVRWLMSIDQNSHSYTSRDGTSCLTLDLSPGRTSRLVVRSDCPCYCTEARLPSVAITLGRGSHTTLYPLKDYWFKLANSHLLWQDEVEEIRGSCNASIFDPKMAKTTKMRILPDTALPSNKTQYDWFTGKTQNSKKLKKTRDLQLFLEDRLPYQKFGRFIVVFGNYGPKTLKLALNGQNFANPWPKICHIRIFPAYREWFSQRRPWEQLPY